jgi:predicted negative regulator of RcsB-dependent stress response
VVLYDQMEEAVHAGDHKKVRDIAAQITDKYGTTPYATMAALSSARAAFTGGDLEAARTQLQWVLDRGREDEIKDVARLRLAGVLLDEKKHDEALKLLEVKPADSLAGLYADLKGDILVTQGKIPEARGAYQAALDQSERGSTYRATIQLKLDALGEAPVAKQ